MIRVHSDQLVTLALVVGLTGCADRVLKPHVSVPASPESVTVSLLPGADVSTNLPIGRRLLAADLSLGVDAGSDTGRTQPFSVDGSDAQYPSVPATPVADTAPRLTVASQPQLPARPGADVAPASTPVVKPSTDIPAAPGNEAAPPRSATVVASSIPAAILPTPSTGALPLQPTPVVSPIKVSTTPASWRIGPLMYIRQTLNNCGPASIAEVLRYWGIERTQGQVQSVLRADGNPRGMVQYGVPGYMHALGMRVLMGVNGNDQLVKSLVAHGFPVIVSQWVSLSDHYGHYRAIDGFDDRRGGFLSTDSYLGPDYFIPYGDFDQMWSTQGQRFMVIYPPSKDALLQSVVAEAGWNKIAAYQTDLTKQQQRQDRMPGGAENGRYWQGYGALTIAWDQMELGRFDLAQAELSQAATHGASPVVVDWISQALSIERG